MRLRKVTYDNFIYNFYSATILLIASARYFEIHILKKSGNSKKGNIEVCICISSLSSVRQEFVERPVQYIALQFRFSGFAIMSFRNRYVIRLLWHVSGGKN